MDRGHDPTTEYRLHPDAEHPDLAEGEGFEPSEACASLVFKTSTFVRSVTPPRPDCAGCSRYSVPGIRYEVIVIRYGIRTTEYGLHPDAEHPDLAEGVGFEPTGPESGPTVFETVTFVRSVTPP